MTNARPLVFVVGTRAQLIKVAPVLCACDAAGLSYELLLTGQHRETMVDLLEEFGVRQKPCELLELRERASILALWLWLPRALWATWNRFRALRRQTGARPDAIVHGDTLSTLVGALAGWLAGARVVHLESGLTSRRLLDPFPEEFVRRLVFRFADIAFCPNAPAAELMRRRAHVKVIDTRENTILDAVRIALRRAGIRPTPVEPRYLVASLHRFQNIYDRERLGTLVEILIRLAKDFRVVLVMHPATRSRLQVTGLLPRLTATAGLELSPRLPYTSFLTLAAQAHAVLTDGGSNQEELAFLGVPTVVMRPRTERPDGLGRNAILEPDLPCPVEAFIMSDKVETLRGHGQIGLAAQPSACIAAVLGGKGE